MVNVSLPYVMKITSRGREYFYYRRGEKPWPRLPSPADPAFLHRYHELNAQFDREARTAWPFGSFGWLYDQFRDREEYKALSTESKKRYRIYLEPLLDEVSPTSRTPYGMASVAALTRANVIDLAKRYGNRPGAYNKFLSAMSAVMNYGIMLELRETNPAQMIPRAKHGEIEPWEETALSGALASSDHLFRLAVALHYYTGQRTSDACAMTWNMVRGGRIFSRQQKKGGKPLSIPIHPALQAELDRAPKGTLTILQNREGSPVKPKVFRRWCQDAGVGSSPHGLRKNAVNALLECGCTPAEVAAITDQSMAMIEHYAKRRNVILLGEVAMGKWGGNKA